jgi:hypothetical protein
MATNIKKHEMLADDATIARLYDGVNVLDFTSCWTWNGAKVKDGYGFLTKYINGKRHTIFAHRLSWVTHYGEVPNGMVVDHTCHTADMDNCIGECKHRACFNPYHLRVVSFAENLRIKRHNTKAFNNLPYGHPEDTGLCRKGIHKWEEGSYTVFKSGKRSCNECRKATNARSMATAKAGA